MSYALKQIGCGDYSRDDLKHESACGSGSNGFGVCSTTSLEDLLADCNAERERERSRDVTVLNESLRMNDQM